MKQFLLPRNAVPGDSLELGGADLHYLSHVRRIKIGENLSCRTPDGHAIMCRVKTVDSELIVLEVTALDDDPRVDNKGIAAIHLVQGIPKGKKFDLIIRQAVELGVASILPLQCQNSIPDFEERWDRKSLRFEGIIREAFQQSGGSVMTELRGPLSVRQMIATWPLLEGEIGLFLHEQELEQSSLHGYLGHIPSELRMVVGPEGGLAPDEVNLLRAAGYKPVFLGSQILRCETAAIVGIGALSIIMQENSFWSLKDRENT